MKFVQGLMSGASALGGSLCNEIIGPQLPVFTYSSCSERETRKACVLSSSSRGHFYAHMRRRFCARVVVL